MVIYIRPSIGVKMNLNASEHEGIDCHFPAYVMTSSLRQARSSRLPLLVSRPDVVVLRRDMDVEALPHPHPHPHFSPAPLMLPLSQRL